MDTSRLDRSIEKILIIHQGALGDFICCLPALACLRRAFPDAHLTLMGYPRVLEVVRNRYYADAIVSVDRADIALLYQGGHEYPPSLRDFLRRFQLIGAVSSNRNPFAENLRKISRGRVVVIPPFPPQGKAFHMVDHLLSLPRGLGVPVHTDRPRLYLQNRDREKGEAFLKDRGIEPDALLIAIHPGSGSRAKTWPPERFLELAETLVADHQAKMLWIMGPGEEDTKEEFLRTHGSKGPVILDGLSLPHVGAILERCSVFIGNDSGITHMAAALGVPVVAIFGPSDPIRWGPRGGEVSLIRRAVPCSPCDRPTMFQCPFRRCLMEISVEEICRAVCRIIGKRGKGPCRAEARRFLLQQNLRATSALP